MGLVNATFFEDVSKEVKSFAMILCDFECAFSYFNL